ncbi:MAG: hypothetical protein WBN65_05060 [Gammaproteobacteria bacterium]
MKMLRMIASVMGVIACLSASVTEADTAFFRTSVDRTLMTGDSKFGGCMALLSKTFADVLPACGNRWVTFSCDGTYTDPVRAYRMLDQAQLALATGMEVNVMVDDSKKHNGYCFASRIDVISP